MTLSAIVLQILFLFLAKLEGNPIPKSVQQNGTGLLSPSSSSSPWLKKVTMNNRDWGCRRRPLICRQEPFLTRVCCRNRCVDVSTDRHNCGSCEIRCRFNSQCCEGLCTDTNIDTSNCGRCGNRCLNGELCSFGMCGYAQPSLPPWPRRPRKPPRPPHYRRPPGGQEPPPAVVV